MFPCVCNVVSTMSISRLLPNLFNSSLEGDKMIIHSENAVSADSTVYIGNQCIAELVCDTT